MKILFLFIGILLLSGFTTLLLFQTSCSSSTLGNSTKTEQFNATITPTPRASDIRNWIAPTYLGVKLGESTDGDVRRLFGKPHYENTNWDEDKVADRDAKKEIVLDYKNPNGASGSVVVIFDKKNRIVKAVSIYPTEKITMEEAISKFGPNFFQKENAPICIEDSEKPGVIDETMQIPFMLVYPNLGLLVDIRKHNNELFVGRIDYLMKCK